MARRAFTLIEIMVVMAVMVAIAMVGFPSLAGLLDLEQRGAAKELSQTYTWLLDEAAMRNVTFRVTYNLDRSTWKVEVGDPDTLIFSNPEDREEYEEELQDKMSRYTDRELAQGAMNSEDGVTDLRDGAQTAQQQFQGLDDIAFTTEQHLPGHTVFDFVYTPQYPIEGVRPTEGELEDEEDAHVAYSYIFPDGTAELTVVRLVDEDDPEDGYTLVVEPLSGQVHLTTDIVDPEQALGDLPEDAPEIR